MIPSNIYIPLAQGVGFIREDFYRRQMKKLNEDFARGKMHENMAQFNWVPFVQATLKEIFVDNARTPLRPAGYISPAAQELVNVGYPPRDAQHMSNEVLKILISEIALVEPDLRFGEIEEWQWGICEPATLMISLPTHSL